MRLEDYQLTPLAEADLETVWAYTLHERSFEQANSYIHDVIDAFEGLRVAASAVGPQTFALAISNMPSGPM